MQVSLYLNDKLAKKVNTVAKARGVSVSSYISEALEKQLNSEYSQAFLSSLGSLSGVDIERPEQPTFSDDSERALL
jgi:metal-responsive CopG/Arc/MetJ family transcriptional regulator